MNGEVTAFWDIENCCIPRKIDPKHIDKIFVSSVRKGGFGTNDLKVNVYGVMDRTADQSTQAILNNGIFATSKVSNKSKDASDMALMLGIFKFISNTPPPANILLISTDSDFSCLMNKLRSYGYNTMLACRRTATTSFKASANIVWDWEKEFMCRSAPGRLTPYRIVSTFTAPGTSNPVMGVFWDMVKCPCPIPIPDRMAYNLESALISSEVVKGRSGSIEYCCFGDSLKLNQLDSNFRANLTSAGFDLMDISDGSKDAKMKGFVNLLMWCFHHPKSSVLLITKDDNFRECIMELDYLGFQMMFAFADPIDEPTRRFLKASFKASSDVVVWSLGTLLNGGPPLTKKELQLILNPRPLQLQNKKRKNAVRG